MAVSIPTDQLSAELRALDQEDFDLTEASLKPSQCYHLGTDPVHLLFNTNCPDALKKRVESIVAKYIPGYETGAGQ
jgi:hypothetical protein